MNTSCHVHAGEGLRQFVDECDQPVALRFEAHDRLAGRREHSLTPGTISHFQGLSLFGGLHDAA